MADKEWAETQGSCPEEAHHPSIHFTDTPKERDHSAIALSSGIRPSAQDRGKKFKAATTAQ
jgi:hypothetical protein